MSLRGLLRTQRGPCNDIAVDRWGPRTAVKVFLIMWVGHVALYYTYDPQVFGERGLFVKIFFAFCLCAGGYMFYRLTKAAEMGFAFRHAVPTVITLWCCVETNARWKAYPDPLAVVDSFLISCIVFALVLLAWLIIRSEKNSGAFGRPVKQMSSLARIIHNNNSELVSGSARRSAGVSGHA